MKPGNDSREKELMDLFDRRGYRVRKHVTEASWDKRKLTVVDLNEKERGLLERGGVELLSRYLSRENQWPFPPLEIREIIPVRRDTDFSTDAEKPTVVLAPCMQPALKKAAAYFVREVKNRFGITLSLRDQEDTDITIFKTRHAILFGGSHQSRLALDLALRYLYGIADSVIPGDGGWLVTTFVGLAAPDKNVIQIAGSPDQLRLAVDYVLGNIRKDREIVRLNHLHHVVPGTQMRKHLISWKDMLVQSLKEGNHPVLRNAKAPVDPVRAAAVFARGFDSGGPEKNYYNILPITAAIRAARYFFITGDPRAMVFFRAILLKLADYYLKTPKGASYLSDMDFYLGILIHYYARLEHYPLFTREDRLILANLLQACAMTVKDYYEKYWKPRFNPNLRHNHETFKARTLFLSADYFARYGVPDTIVWAKKADLLFSGNLWTRYKQIENANAYEPIVFEHLASYSAFLGNRFGLFGRDVLTLAARRQMICADNFFRPVDYGDSAVQMNSRNSDSLAVLAVCASKDPHLQWFSRNSFRQSHPYLTPVFFALTGLRRSEPGTMPPCGTWETAQMDPQALRQYAPGFARRYAFDKMAYRTGWNPQDQYLIFNGFGNLSISHSHNELNGIVRLNHLGRHWLVSNGYGKKPGISNASKSYYGRELGPEDHNMLVLKQGGEVVKDLPPACALLTAGSKKSHAWLTSALCGYAGTNWYRTLVVLTNAWLLVIDRVQVMEPNELTGHLEWNFLGKLQAVPMGWRVSQKGVFMDVLDPSHWDTRSGVMASEDWRVALNKKDYPYADYPPRKIIYDLPAFSSSGIVTHATLFAATKSSELRYSIREIAPGHYGIKGPKPRSSLFSLDSRDLRLGVTKNELEIQVSLSPRLPSTFRKKPI
ncbi:MAG: hypothetical protein WC975_05265 [Phycisphaerae bacterium]